MEEIGDAADILDHDAGSHFALVVEATLYRQKVGVPPCRDTMEHGGVIGNAERRRHIAANTSGIPVRQKEPGEAVGQGGLADASRPGYQDRKSTRLNSSH